MAKIKCQTNIHPYRGEGKMTPESKVWREYGTVQAVVRDQDEEAFWAAIALMMNAMPVPDLAKFMADEGGILYDEAHGVYRIGVLDTCETRADSECSESR